MQILCRKTWKQESIGSKGKGHPGISTEALYRP